MEKKRNHPVLSHPIPAAFLLLLHGFFWTSLAQLAGWISDEASSIAIVLAAFLLLAFHKFWFRPEYKGSVNLSFLRDRQAVACAAAFFVLDAVMLCIQYAFWGFTGISLSLLLNALCAGIAEEAVCRGLAVSVMMRKYKDGNSYLPALLLPALLFGLLHCALALRGAGTDSVVTTVVSAAFAGLFFAALFLRTGSVVPSMLLHFLHDLLAMMVADTDKDMGLLDPALYFLLLALLLACTVLLLRGHKADILATWKDRWSGADTEKA